MGTILINVKSGNLNGNDYMNLMRIRMHHLIEQLADEDLYNVWNIIQGLHYDFYMLRSIEELKELQQPWDMLTLEEATKQLMFF